MTRIAIIDHDSNKLYVEDISDQDFKDYNGDIQSYIEDNYTLGYYSWDYISDTEYLPEDDKTPVEVNFEDTII